MKVVLILACVFLHSAEAKRVVMAELQQDSLEPQAVSYGPGSKDTTTTLHPFANHSLADLYGQKNVHQVKALLAPKSKLSQKRIYARLLELMIKQRGDTPGKGQFEERFERNREIQRQYVLDQYRKLMKPSRKSQKPLVTFVLGATAVGKSTFSQGQHQEPNTLHLNADDVRSMLVGNYWVYAQLLDQLKIGESDSAAQEYAQDCNKIRIQVQNEILRIKGNFLADSYKVPAFAITGFVKAGYDVRVYYLEIGFEGSRFDGWARKHKGKGAKAEREGFHNKVLLSRERIQERMDKGLHGSGQPQLMPDGFIKELRENVNKLAVELKVKAPKVRVEFYISQNGRFDHVGDMAKVDPKIAGPTVASPKFKSE